MSAPLVVKIGGSALDRLDDGWWDDLGRLGRRGPLVCVHGWSRQLAEHQRQQGREPEFLIDQHGHRSRLTDHRVLSEIRLVSDRVRGEIGTRLKRRRLAVASCVGDRDGLLVAESRSLLWWQEGRLVPLTNLVGRICHVETGRLRERLSGSDAVVVTPLAREARHGAVNTDGDRAAASLAAAVGAEHLLLVTDVGHVRAEGDDLRRVRRADLDQVIRGATGGMRKKLLAASEALAGGVGRVHVGSVRPSALLAGAGTVILP